MHTAELLLAVILQPVKVYNFEYFISICGCLLTCIEI